MWIELPPLWIALINALGIPATHLAIAKWSQTRPASTFQPTSFPYRTLPFEKSGKFYTHILHIRTWKNRLPDGAAWLGGFAKAKLTSTKPEYLQNFIRETCRGEQSHWLQLFAICLFILWTPYPAALVIPSWAILSNLPCILNLRHTRHRLSKHPNLKT